MNNYGYIYRITNLLDDTTYVGQRRGNFSVRYLGSGMLIKRAVSKYGRANFRVVLLEYTNDQAQLDEREKYHIDGARAVGRTYNIRDGGLGSLFNGFGSMKGRKFTPEQRQKLRDAHVGRDYSGMADISGEKNPMFGRHHSIETKRKIGAATRGGKGPKGRKRPFHEVEAMSQRMIGKPAWNTGIPHNQDTKEKISARAKARYESGYKQPARSEESRKKMSETMKRVRAEKSWNSR